MRKLRIGLDVHGVIDKYPEVFAALSRALVKDGHDVHVVTGPSRTPDFEAQLRVWGIDFTHFCSIIDYRAEQGIAVTYDERGPWVRPEEWDTAKAEYCEKEKIDLMIDDSDVYHRHFKTPYLRCMR